MFNFKFRTSWIHKLKWKLVLHFTGAKHSFPLSIRDIWSGMKRTSKRYNHLRFNTYSKPLNTQLQWQIFSIIVSNPINCFKINLNTIKGEAQQKDKCCKAWMLFILSQMTTQKRRKIKKKNIKKATNYKTRNRSNGKSRTIGRQKHRQCRNRSWQKKKKYHKHKKKGGRKYKSVKKIHLNVWARAKQR